MITSALLRPVIWLLVLLVALPPWLFAQEVGTTKAFSQEELDQLLAPIALYPDSLLAQILMASTYPLEVVQAQRWVKENPDLKGDALTAALEQQNWDPSVKSLVNFPQVLDMMNAKLDWTQKLGDAFLAQQKEVMDTVQKLREKAESQGNLKSSDEHKVIVEKETQTIIIEPADPQVVYVPTYNPTVVYGPWWYPAYPPYYYYPPGYAAGAALFTFGVGVAIGAAWGYAWGGCGWGHSEVDIDIDRNTNINAKIDRDKYQDRVTNGQGGRGEWKHDPEHRKGVSYRDERTAEKFGRGEARDAQSREAFRGRAEAGRQDLALGGAQEFRDRSAGGRQDSAARREAGSFDGMGSQQRRESGGTDRAGAQRRSEGTAFGGYDRGSQTRDFSSRGHRSMSSARARGGFGGGGRRR